MDIETLTDTLFNNISTTNTIQIKVLKDSDNIPSREAKTLEYQMNKHLHDRYKATTKVSFTKPSMMATLRFENIVDEEILKNRKKAKTWNALNTCDKWNLIKEYYKSKNEKINEKIIKQQLLSNELIVCFDKDNNCLKSIEIKGSDQTS
jgi:hypothetical protein